MMGMSVFSQMRPRQAAPVERSLHPCLKRCGIQHGESQSPVISLALIGVCAGARGDSRR